MSGLLATSFRQQDHWRIARRMTDEPCARHRDRRAALPSVDDAGIISLAEALARGMKPIEAVCMTQYMTPWKSKPQKTKAELYERPRPSATLRSPSLGRSARRRPRGINAKKAAGRPPEFRDDGAATPPAPSLST